jgi:predicted  nucleic acid-binding Zn-ribbon protein
MSRVSNLSRLQNTDQELDRCRKRLEQISAALADSAAANSARANLEQVGAARQAAQLIAKDGELAAATQRAKLNETERSLYGGSVRNPKELQDLQREAESLQRHVAALEDKLLETMVELEDRERDLEVAKDELVRVESAAANGRGILIREQAEVEARCASLESEREVSVAGVAPKDLALYTELRESMGGRVVAVLHDGACGACGLALAASALQSVRNSTELFRCTQCGRILYSG